MPISSPRPANNFTSVHVVPQVPEPTFPRSSMPSDRTYILASDSDEDNTSHLSTCSDAAAGKTSPGKAPPLSSTPWPPHVQHFAEKINGRNSAARPDDIRGHQPGNPHERNRTEPIDIPARRPVARTRYQGQWSHNQRHGYGQIHYPNGDTYHGDWKHNQKHGHGQFRWAKGDIYTGQWRYDQMHGDGRWTSANGAIYDGAWRVGQQHGQGLLSGV